LHTLDATQYKGIDLYAGGLPCPPFSIAGKQLGVDDERNLFDVALRHISECDPKAVMIENVKGMLDKAFDSYRQHILSTLRKMNYRADWKLLNAADYGVPQLRPRLVLVAIKAPLINAFEWPRIVPRDTLSVGETIHDLIAARGWKGASRWRLCANKIAPTIVGGSKKHGGPDLGPTRARRAWAELGVNGIGIADEAPDADYPQDGMPKLTTRMVARLQGFPDDWHFEGRKTHAYRQVGNAFPPPVAKAVAIQIARAVGKISRRDAA